MSGRDRERELSGVSARPLHLSSYPRAIAHIDGDAFFTSVEQAIHPEWKGKPVVTGKERGIIACASYEAKALGIKRGVRLHEAKAMCRELIVVPSDYETYSLYSKRMFGIFRDFSPMVEEHSIDEGFVDLTGLRPAAGRCRNGPPQALPASGPWARMPFGSGSRAGRWQVTIGNVRGSQFGPLAGPACRHRPRQSADRDTACGFRHAAGRPDRGRAQALRARRA